MIFKRILELLFPSKCVLCRQILAKDELDLCRYCRANAPRFHPGRGKIRFVKDYTAVWFYEDDVRGSLIRYKFNRARHYSAAYGRMVASADEKAWVQTAILPQYAGQTDGGVTLPLIFLFVYDANMAKPENYAFLYGQILSFGDLEEYKVLEDQHYAIYDATRLIYTDVDTYLDDFLTRRTDVYCDDQIRQRVHNIYDFYQDRENIKAMYGYLRFPEP